MLTKLLARVGIYTTNGWHEGYDNGYREGLDAGTDFGKRIAYNSVLREELGGILSRYGQLQVKLLTKPKKEIQSALADFEQQEIKRFEMELQDR